MLPLSSTASKDEIIAAFARPEFDPHAALRDILPRYENKESLGAIQSRTVELMATLDHQSSQLAGDLSKSLEALEKSKSKLGYQIELLANDLVTLHSNQSYEKSHLMSELRGALESHALLELSRLRTTKARMEEVNELLVKAAELDGVSVPAEFKSLLAQGLREKAEARLREMEVLAKVLAGTVGEAEVSKLVVGMRKELNADGAELRPSTPAGDNYYTAFKRLL